MASKEINDFTEQTTLNATDEALIQETGGGTTKKTLVSTVRDYILGYVTSLTGKATPVSADEFLINDSADSNAPKKLTLANLTTYIGGAIVITQSSSTKTGDYTVLDDDGFDLIYLSGASAASTFTLPTLADNTDRVITLVNNDSTYSLTIDGEGAETIDGCDSIELPKQYNKIKIIGGASEWVILEESISAQLRLDTKAGYGSTDTKILRYTNVIDNYGNMFTENHVSGYNSNTEGLKITITKAGKYSAVATIAKSANTTWQEMCLSLNASATTTDPSSLAVAERLTYSREERNAEVMTVSFTGYFDAGDIIRPQLTSFTSGADAIAQFSITYIS